MNSARSVVLLTGIGVSLMVFFSLDGTTLERAVCAIFTHYIFDALESVLWNIEHNTDE